MQVCCIYDQCVLTVGGHVFKQPILKVNQQRDVKNVCDTCVMSLSDFVFDFPFFKNKNVFGWKKKSQLKKKTASDWYLDQHLSSDYGNHLVWCCMVSKQHIHFVQHIRFYSGCQSLLTAGKTMFWLWLHYCFLDHSEVQLETFSFACF